MRIASWNVNSVRARQARVTDWLRRHRPDVLCLQELKTTDAAFPREAIRETGYKSAVHGQKAFNGVALLSPEPVTGVRFGMDNDDRQARLIGGVARSGPTATGVTVYSAYFPNGRKVGSDAYAYKLSWMARLLELLEERHDPRDPVVLAGDFNVAPDDRDANDPAKWAESVLCHSAVRGALERIREWGFVDVVRKHNPDGGLFSWWDYRRLAFPRNDGLRIDHIFATAPVAEASTGAWVDRDQRKGRKTDVPSDHAPVVAEFDL